MRKIEAFNKEDQKLLEPVQRYLDILNSFFSDSGKEIRMVEAGRGQILLPSGIEGDVFLLSSGERQIFVLLTHLAFNPSSKAANVLIVDEPELSLHLKWQENFVSAVQQINPGTQMVLATHSPTIIMERDNRCVLLG
jgi:predicted ATPase